MSAPNQAPVEQHHEEARQVHSFEDAVAYTRDSIDTLRWVRPEGLALADGGSVRPEDLEKGLADLVVDAAGEVPDPQLEQFAILLARISAESGSRDPYRAEEDPMMAFLITRGGYKHEANQQPPALAAAQSTPSATGTRRAPAGHQVIADGRVVHGRIVPGVGVQTTRGIVKAFETPRMGNS